MPEPNQVTGDLVQMRISVPQLAQGVILRPRLVRLIRELVHSYGIVSVTGTAGSGKTSAVLQAASSTPHPLAWLTVHGSDEAPGRLLTYLEASLVRVLPKLPRAVTQAFSMRVPLPEAAALLAEVTAGHPMTLVIDELERIADSSAAREVLSAFLRYTSPSLRTILVSRRRIDLDVGSGKALGGIGSVSEADLAFTVEEAEQVLEKMHRSPSEASAVVDATRGWVAGVLFEAWRSDAHVHGAGGETDPLSGYLSREIMGHLPEQARDFLVETSLLDEVTPEFAEALGIPFAADVMAMLASYRLPVTFGADRLAMRCHPRFREYLESQLAYRSPGRVRELRQAYANLLVAEHHHEEAVEQLLEANDRDEAARVAEHVILDVIRRLDFPVAERWLATLSRDSVESSAVLTSAEILVALEHEQYGDSATAADRMLAQAELGDATLPADLGCAIAWSYYLVVRIEDAYRVLARTQPGTQVDAMRFALGVDMIDDPIRYQDRPPDTGHYIDGLMAKIDFSHGRFMRVVSASTPAWTAVRTSRMGALHSLGRTEEAMDLITNDQELDEVTSFRVSAEILADLGRVEEARAAIARGHAKVRRSGSVISALLERQTEAMILLRHGGDLDVVAMMLAETEQHPVTHRHVRLLEQHHICHGLLSLLRNDDLVAAEHLRTAVDMQRTWDRLLLLPEAAIYLAEAEWRLGNEEQADLAADTALDAAERQSSNYRLLRALRQFPAVASRRLDAERGSDSAWHKLGRTLMTDGLTVRNRAGQRMHLHEFGEPALLVDGVLVTPRLSKSLELLSFLAATGGPVRRAHLLSALFDSRSDDSARSYLRQAINALRQVLADDHELFVDDAIVHLRGPGVSADSHEFQRLAGEAMQQRGHARLGDCLRALQLYDRGDYLGGISSPWTSARREVLRELANDTLQAAAEWAFEISDMSQAEELTGRILTDDPYRESAWRLSMRIAGAMGDDDRVIARYRSCDGALRLVGAVPAESTRRLLEALRR